MLNIFADSLLLATRMQPLSRGYGDERDEFLPEEAPGPQQRRSWISWMGVHL